MVAISLIVSLVSFGQVTKQVKPIKESKIKVLGEFKASASIYEDNTDVVITYSDYKFKEINVYKSFVLSQEDFESLYNTLINADYESDDTFQLKTKDDGRLIIKPTKVLGVKTFLILHTSSVGVEGELPLLNKNQITKLFFK